MRTPSAAGLPTSASRVSACRSANGVIFGSPVIVRCGVFWKVFCSACPAFIEVIGADCS